MLLISSRRRWLKPLAFLMIPAFILLYLQNPQALTARMRKTHTITNNSIRPVEVPSPSETNPNPNGTHGFIPLPEAISYCQKHEFEVYPHRETRRKVYDLFMVNTELDWLDVRLNTLKDAVDYFVIVEADKTFTGIPRDLYLASNWGKYQPFHDKMIYHLLNDSMINSNSSWDHEDLQRDAMFDQVFFDLSGPKKPQEGDIILVSDVDEIPRPETVTVLRNCQFPRRLTLRSRFYYYGFQWLHHGPEWDHPQATFFTGERTIRPANLRKGGIGTKDRIYAPLEKADLWNAAWHCSSCFATLEETLTKMSSFSHTKYNLPEFRKRAGIAHRIRNGLDLFDRAGETYDRVDNNDDVPPFVKQDPLRFRYLLDRDPLNANFADYDLLEAEADMIQEKSLGRGSWGDGG